jgi:hypothetical protein
MSPRMGIISPIPLDNSKVDLRFAMEHNIPNSGTLILHSNEHSPRIEGVRGQSLIHPFLCIF